MLAVQCKMARVAVGWGVRELAKAAGVATDTVARLERGETLREGTLHAIQRALEGAGVEFTNGDAPGVRLRRQKHLTVEEGGTDKAEPADATEVDPPHREG